MPNLDGFLLLTRACSENFVVMRPRNSPDNPRVSILDLLELSEIQGTLFSLEETELAISSAGE